MDLPLEPRIRALKPFKSGGKKPFGVNSPARTVSPDVPQIAIRRNLHEVLAQRHFDCMYGDGRTITIDSVEFTRDRGQEIIEEWQMLMETDCAEQSRINPWRRSWLRRFRRPPRTIDVPLGIRGDVTLLPAAWSRMISVLNHREYHLDDLVLHACAIIEETILKECCWRDIEETGGKGPVDAGYCQVYKERTVDKPSRLCRKTPNVDDILKTLQTSTPKRRLAPGSGRVWARCARRRAQLDVT